METRVRRSKANIRIWIGVLSILLGTFLTIGSFFVFSQWPKLQTTGIIFYGLIIAGFALVISGIRRDPDKDRISRKPRHLR